ncbi:ABC transporter ATP-binding protein [Neobacillus sp. LXY-4]|uniref:ABC transporter ATP-binding protein n=1 Tax=Neobacillus sp. LXY-4 TaxID=3379826 RepID=UPI003EE355EB
MKLDQVVIGYGEQTIIDSVDLTIANGETFVLMGPSGSGKSTLLKGIAGLLPQRSGIMDWGSGKGTTGLVFQEPRLFPHLTVMENLAFGLRAKGMPRKERIKRVSEYLEVLQLQGLENRYPHQLSGGQQQRVSLGRVLVLKPDLLLLDEPFASLDPPLRAQLTEWLYQLQKEQGFSILWVTHYLDEAYAVADQVGVMMDGKILQVGKPRDFFQKPCSEKVASFFSLSNRFPLEIWKQWLPININETNQEEMGWIPANELYLCKSEAQETHQFEKVVWIEGVVHRVKHETKGQAVFVDCLGVKFEIQINVFGEIPNIDEIVKVGVPTNKIIWYPK